MNIITSQLLLKWLISFGVLYLFYVAFLKKTTFFRQRRWFLFVGTFLALLVPFVTLQIADKEIDHSTIVQYIQKMPVLPETASSSVTELLSRHLSIETVLSYVILLGFLFFLIRFILIIFSFKKITKNAKHIDTVGNTKIYSLETDVPAFSFGNKIFIGNNFLSEDERTKIILHELAHVTQYHSWDTIWMELLTVFNWFNPFVWFLKKETRDNLEFLADKSVLGNEIDKKEYQYLLLNTLLHNNHQAKISFTNNFNISSLKKRITMMNKNRTSKIKRWRILLILPILGMLLFSFRKNPSPNTIQIAGIVVDADTKQPIRNATIKFDSTLHAVKTNSKGFYQVLIERSDTSKLSVNFQVTKSGYKVSNAGSSFQGGTYMIANVELATIMSKMPINVSFQKNKKLVNYTIAKNYLNETLASQNIVSNLKKEKKFAIVKNGIIYIIAKNGYSSLTPDNMENALQNITVNRYKKVTLDELNKNYNADDFVSISIQNDKINLETRNN